jgi:hypothetical protein
MKFKEYLNEASLSKKTLIKDSTRLNNFATKFAKEEPFITTDGKEVILKTDPVVLAQIETGNVPNEFQVKGGGTIKLTKLEKTAEFGGQGGKKSSTKGPSGAQWESLITYAWNGEDKMELTDKKAVDTFWNTNHSDVAKVIATNLRPKLKDKKADMIQFGTGGGTKISLSKEWKGSNKTPKTDMYVGTTRISLKKAGGSQVMSAKRDEALSTFEAAIAYVGKKNSKKVKELIKTLQEGMSETIKITSDVGKIKKKTEKDLHGTDHTVLKFDKFHTTAKKTVREFFMAKENEIFKEFFTYEAASGETKFGLGSTPVANYMITFDAIGGDVEVEHIGENSKPSASIIKLSQKVTFDVNFKSSSGTTYSALRVMKQEAKKDKKVKVESTQTEEYETIPTMMDIYEQTEKEFDMYLSEGLFSSAMDKAKSFFSSFWNKVKAVLNKIANLGAKAFQAVLQFFGLAVKDVSATGPAFLFGDKE